MSEQEMISCYCVTYGCCGKLQRKPTERHHRKKDLSSTKSNNLTRNGVSSSSSAFSTNSFPSIPPRSLINNFPASDNSDLKSVVELLKKEVSELKERFAIQSQMPAPSPIRSQMPAPNPIQSQMSAPNPIQIQMPAPKPVMVDKESQTCWQNHGFDQPRFDFDEYFVPYSQPSNLFLNVMHEVIKEHGLDDGSLRSKQKRASCAEIMLLMLGFKTDEIDNKMIKRVRKRLTDSLSNKKTRKSTPVEEGGLPQKKMKVEEEQDDIVLLYSKQPQPQTESEITTDPGSSAHEREYLLTYLK